MKVSLAVAIAATAALATSCGEPRSLINVDVTGDRIYSQVTLVVKAAPGGGTKTFRRVNFGPSTIFQVGIYLSADVTGRITIVGEADDGRCVLGRGLVTVPDLKSGEVTAPIRMTIGMVPGGCDPIGGGDAGAGADAGAGTDASGGGRGGTSGPGSGGAPGSGGRSVGVGSGGRAGTGGTGAGSVSGSGGTGTGGVVGSGGAGVIGSGGLGVGTGGRGTGGAVVIGTGGRGTGGAVVTGTGGRGTGGAVVIGTGGRGTGGAGIGGAGTGGAGTGGAGPITIAGLNNAFLISPCADVGTASDCSTVADSQECGPANQSHAETFTVTGGIPGVLYTAVIRIRGLVEAKYYGTGCLRAAGATPPAQGSNAGNMVCTSPSLAPLGTYNTFELEVLNLPAIPGQLRYIRFNSHSSLAGEAHYVYAIDETAKFLVRSGSTLVLRHTDLNCRATMNCGEDEVDYQIGNEACRKSARAVDGVTLPAQFRGGPYPAPSNGPAQPFQAQFLTIELTDLLPS